MGRKINRNSLYENALMKPLVVINKVTNKCLTDDSAIKMVSCSSGGPEFSSKQPHLTAHNFLELQLQGI